MSPLYVKEEGRSQGGASPATTKGGYAESVSRVGPLLHQAGALAVGDLLAALVDGAVLEQDDAGVRPGLAFALLGDSRRAVPRVAVEHGLRETAVGHAEIGDRRTQRSEEHTSELQSLMRISYAVFCLKKTKH